MDSFEKDAFQKGYRTVAGVDEAGRGPLAGPVVSAAVVFKYPPPLNIGINDSKALSAAKRNSLVFEIYRRASSVGIGVIWPGEIDRLNIHKASLKAMEIAVGKLSVKPDLIFIDGGFPIETDTEQRPIISGDALSVSIAAASIIAKTTRDAIMEAYHSMYPGYEFLSNKGYGTKDHLSALRRLGPTPIHRRSFRWGGADGR